MTAPGGKKNQCQEINLNINPLTSYSIHKRYNSGRGELSEACKNLWKSINENSKTLLPLGLQPNLLLRLKRDELPVHTTILAAFSDNVGTWSAMCLAASGGGGGHWKCPFELDLTEKAPIVTKEALFSVIQFLYVGKINFSMNDLPEILEAANFFGISELKNRTSAYLIRFAKENPITLTSCLQLSFTYDLPSNVRDILVALMADQFSKFLANKNRGRELYELSGEVIEAVLSSNDLNVPAPIEKSVFSFALQWLKKNRRDSPEFANALMDVCRFDKMTTQEMYQCLDDARHAGFDHLIRSKIMQANWQKTCKSWNQMDKCDRPKPKRKHATEMVAEKQRGLPNSNRPSGSGQSPGGVFVEEQNNAIKETLQDTERLSSTNQRTPYSEDRLQRSEDRKFTEEILDPEFRRGGRRAKHQKSKIEKKPQTEEFSTSSSRKSQQWSSETPPPLVADDKVKATADELTPSSSPPPPPPPPLSYFSSTTPPPQSPLISSQQQTDRSKQLKEAALVFISLLNKRGKRLLMDRMMEPNFGSEFFKILMCGGDSGSHLKSSLKSNVVIGHEFDEQNLPEKNFVYSPESSDYKSYLDTMRLVESEGASKIARRGSAPLDVGKPFNGGRPMALRQSVIHTKMDDDGRVQKVAYEQKYFREAPKPSANSHFNSISLS